MINCQEFYPLILEAFQNNLDFVMPIKGTSMLPFLCTKDKVTLTKITELKKHDLVFYRRKNGQFVLHRIYKIKKDGFVLLGDHQINKEYPIYPEQIIAKVKKVYIAKKSKTFELKGFKYRMYLFFWHFLFLRRCILFIYNRVHHEA